MLQLQDWTVLATDNSNELLNHNVKLPNVSAAQN